MKGHLDSVVGALLLEDGRRVLSWSLDNTIRVWDVASGQSLAALDEHQDSVSGVLLLGDGRHALSWSRDNTLRVWDLDKYFCMAMFMPDDPIQCVLWDCFHQKVVVGDNRGRIYFLTLINPSIQ
jgi:WD40 repeat protein